MSPFRRVLLVFACLCLLAQQAVALAPTGCTHGRQHDHAAAANPHTGHAGHAAPATPHDHAQPGHACDCGCPCVANACAQTGVLFALPEAALADSGVARLDAPTPPPASNPEAVFPAPLLRPPIFA